MMFDVNQPTASDYPELVAAMDRARLTMGAVCVSLRGRGNSRAMSSDGAYLLVGDARSGDA